jgi:hypothetical protein
MQRFAVNVAALQKLRRRAPARRAKSDKEEKRMRKIVIATLIAAGIGFVGVSAGSAAPVNNTVLKQTATKSDATIQVQWWRHRHRCHGPRSRWWWC